VVGVEVLDVGFATGAGFDVFGRGRVVLDAAAVGGRAGRDEVVDSCLLVTSTSSSLDSGVGGAAASVAGGLAWTSTGAGAGPPAT
jgi:hypothetical protein